MTQPPHAFDSPWAGGTKPLDILAKILWLREQKWVGYAVAIAGATFGLYLHLALGRALATDTFLTFFPGIALATLVGGRLSGGTAAALSAAFACFYLIAPLHSLLVTWPAGCIELLLFLAVVAILIELIDHAVTVSGQLARATALLRASHDRLAAQGEERAAQLLAKDALIQTFFEHSSQAHAVLVATEDGKFRYEEVNPATLRLYGLPRGQVIGRTVDDLFEPARAAELNAHLALCLQKNAPHHYERQHGKAIIEALATPVPDDAGQTRRLVVSANDISERRLLEQQLRQSQKMEAVGQLTGGIAHDFNNLLTGISGSIELLENRIAQGRIGDLSRYIETAKGAAKRAAVLTHRLLAFSRRQTLDPKPTDINRLLAGLDELIRRTVGPAIAVELAAADGLWSTHVDQNQLENAVLNLSINARDAMPDGGRLTLATANRSLDQRAAAERDLPPGQYVSLCVSDTGTGMEPDVAARAFDPFFTTKPLGAGTGLGLSMVYGFARQSGGQAKIYSEPARGTMVCLYLPRHLADQEPPEPAPEISGIARLEGGGIVLVVDDEPAVRMLIADVLKDMGLTPLTAEDGKFALQLLESGRQIDLLITDVGLPGGIGGRQLAQAARALRPDLKTLFITGFAESAVAADGHLNPGAQILTKPFTMDDLANRIKDAIAQPSDG